MTVLEKAICRILEEILIEIKTINDKLDKAITEIQNIEIEGVN